MGAWTHPPNAPRRTDVEPTGRIGTTPSARRFEPFQALSRPEMA